MAAAGVPEPRRRGSGAVLTEDQAQPAVATGPVEPRLWPKRLAEQVRAVRAALVEGGRVVSVRDGQ